jgi:hypothetical protein
VILKGSGTYCLLAPDKQRKDFKLENVRKIAKVINDDIYPDVLYAVSKRCPKRLRLKGPKPENIGTSFLHHQSLSGWAAYELDEKFFL